LYVVERDARDRKTLAAIDSRTGDFRWRGFNPFYIYSQLAVKFAAGTTAYATVQGMGVVAIDTQTQQIKWRQDVHEGLRDWSNTTVTEEECRYLRSLGGDEGVRWVPGEGCQVRVIWQARFSPLALFGDTVLIWGIDPNHHDIIIGALDAATGHLRWSFLPDQYRHKLRNKPATSGPTTAIFLGSDSRGIFFALEDELVIIEVSTGEVKSRTSIDGPVVAAVRAGNTVYVATKDSVRAIGIPGGKTQWIVPIKGVRTLSVSDDLVFLMAPNVLFALEANNGEVRRSLANPGGQVEGFTETEIILSSSEGVRAIRWPRPRTQVSGEGGPSPRSPFAIVVKRMKSGVGCSMVDPGPVVSLDLEEDYLPIVVASETPNAPLEALKAQAIASRTFALYKMQFEPRSTSFHVCDTEADQVYNPSVAMRPEHRRAVEETRGLVAKWNGEIISTFFVAGTAATKTSRFVTINEGKTGENILQTALGWVTDPPSRNPFNRGALGQAKANQLAEQGWDYKRILRYFYGADLAIEALDPFTPGATVEVLGTGGANLNVRSSPHLLGDNIIAKVAPGTQVQILGGPQVAERYRWYHVKLADGKEGWAASRYLKVAGKSDAIPSSRSLSLEASVVAREMYGEVIGVPLPEPNLIQNVFPSEELKMVESLRLHVRVDVRLQGQPVRGAEVFLHSVDGPRLGTTDQAGKVNLTLPVLFSGEPSGEQVQVFVPPAPATRKVSIAARHEGQTATIELELFRAERLRSRTVVVDKQVRDAYVANTLLLKRLQTGAELPAQLKLLQVALTAMKIWAIHETAPQVGDELIVETWRVSVPGQALIYGFSQRLVRGGQILVNQTTWTQDEGVIKTLERRYFGEIT
jgi:outer membrane protein assembly factor BamB